MPPSQADPTPADASSMGSAQQEAAAKPDAMPPIVSDKAAIAFGCRGFLANSLLLTRWFIVVYHL